MQSDKDYFLPDISSIFAVISISGNSFCNTSNVSEFISQTLTEGNSIPLFLNSWWFPRSRPNILSVIKSEIVCRFIYKITQPTNIETSVTILSMLIFFPLYPNYN